MRKKVSSETSKGWTHKFVGNVNLTKKSFVIWVPGISQYWIWLCWSNEFKDWNFWRFLLFTRFSRIPLNLAALDLYIFWNMKFKSPNFRDFSTSNLAAVRIAALCTSLLNIQYQVTFSTPTTKLGKDKIFIIISIVKRMEARRES